MDQQNQEQAGSTKGIDTLKHASYNPRTIDKPEFEALVRSMREFGDLSGVVKNLTTGELVGGNQRLEVFKRMQKPHIAITQEFSNATKAGTVRQGYVVDDNGEQFAYREVVWDLPREQAANIAANRIQGRFDVDLLAKLNYELSQLEDGSNLLELTGQSKSEIDKLLDLVGANGEREPNGNLADDFIAPPFSILDTKQGYWQDRRGEWLGLGIKSELGREENLLSEGKENLLGAINNGTSIFDPVLCELAYQWFNVPGGQVLDPFAGGSVRGVVASKLGMPYLGIDLSGKQLEANREQAAIIGCDPAPVWLEGDSMNIEQHVGTGFAADFIFSCPPYADLEVYSDAPNDLSNMDYKEFTSAYWDIISRSVALLKPNRFAVFVVGEVRAKKGQYYNFVGDTIQAFLDAGLSYYNELILVNPAGTLPLRAGKVFNAGRKIGKQHQNVLVFYKGDLKNIKTDFKELDFSKLPEVANDTPADSSGELTAVG